jgi:glutaredoxin
MHKTEHEVFMVVEHVNGKNRGRVMLYALSTCQWCNKTKELLKDLGVEFDYEYVDLLDEKEQDKAMNALEKWNPRGSFPTLVIDDRRCIVGFREQEIREALAA